MQKSRGQLVETIARVKDGDEGTRKESGGQERNRKIREMETIERGAGRK